MQSQSLIASDRFLDESGDTQATPVGIPDGNVAEPYGGENDDGEIQAFVADDEVIEALDVEIILTEEEEELIQAQKTRRMVLAVICCVILLVVIIVPASLSAIDDGSNTRAPTISPTLSPSASPSSAPSEASLKTFVGCLDGVTSQETFGMRDSPQWKALNWIVYDDPYVNSIGLDCETDEWVTRYVLATFFFAMNGENWLECGLGDENCAINTRQFGWMSNHNVCDWHRVVCTNTSSVIGMSFGAQFPNLRLLTQLVGKFPSELGYIVGLRQMQFKDSLIEGTIPDFFTAFKELEEFNVENNNMEGPLPEFLTGTNFPKLRTLLLTNNKFVGTIPTAHGTLNSLQEYRIASNLLTGKIPTELANIQALAYLDLAENQLDGPMPEGIFDRTELRVLSLHNNEISGTLPDDISKLVFLRNMRLQFTRFNGTIPNALFDIEFLQEVNLRSTRITGQIDPAILNAEFLQIYDIGITQINGNIPDIFGDVPYLEELRLDFTELTGNISQKVCDTLGDGFGEIEILVVDCSIGRPSSTCGECVEPVS